LEANTTKTAFNSISQCQRYPNNRIGKTRFQFQCPGLSICIQTGVLRKSRFSSSYFHILVFLSKTMNLFFRKKNKSLHLNFETWKTPFKFFVSLKSSVYFESDHLYSSFGRSSQMACTNFYANRSFFISTQKIN